MSAMKGIDMSIFEEVCIAMGAVGIFGGTILCGTYIIQIVSQEIVETVKERQRQKNKI